MADRIVGLDIGSRGIKAAQARVFPGKGAQVESLASIALPGRSVREGEVKERETVSDFLRDLWKDNNIASKDVIIGVNNAKVFTGIGEFPYLDPHQLKLAHRDLIKERNVVSADVDNSLIDYLVLGETGEGLDRKLKVLVFATPILAVEGLVGAATDAGLNVVGVDLGALATLRALQVPQHDGEYVDVVVDVGHDLVTILMHKSGSPRYINVITGIGGRQATTMVRAQITGINEDEAEKIKVNSNGGGEPGVAINRAVDGIVKAVDQAMRHYTELDQQFPGIVGITLTGGSSLLAGLQPALNERFGIPVHYGVPDSSYVTKGGTLEAFLPDGRSAITAVGLVTGRRG